MTEEDYNKGYGEGFRAAMEIAASHIETGCPYPKKVIGASSLYAIAVRLRQMSEKVEEHDWAKAYSIAAALGED